MITKPDKNKVRRKRHLRLRRHISGTASAPRLNVYKSLSHIYVQLIDDEAHATLVSANSLEKDIAEQLKDKTKAEAAAIVGQIAGERAVEKGIKKVVFDRGGYLYTGRIQALADGARKAGLEF